MAKFPGPRTCDVWVARWNAPGTPGKFRVIVDCKALGETCGTNEALTVNEQVATPLRTGFMSLGKFRPAPAKTADAIRLLLAD